MNLRIRELVGRAEAYAYEHEEHWHDGPDWQELFNKKFAELIVNETADWINDNVGMIDEDARADLLKHFGINRE